MVREGLKAVQILHNCSACTFHNRRYGRAREHALHALFHYVAAKLIETLSGLGCRCDCKQKLMMGGGLASRYTVSLLFQLVEAYVI